MDDDFSSFIQKFCKDIADAIHCYQRVVFEFFFKDFRKVRLEKPEGANYISVGIVDDIPSTTTVSMVGYGNTPTMVCVDEMDRVTEAFKRLSDSMMALSTYTAVADFKDCLSSGIKNSKFLSAEHRYIPKRFSAYINTKKVRRNLPYQRHIPSRVY